MRRVPQGDFLRGTSILHSHAAHGNEINPNFNGALIAILLVFFIFSNRFRTFSSCV